MKTIKLSLVFIIIGILSSSTIYSQSGDGSRIGTQVETGYGIKLNNNSADMYQLFVSSGYRVNHNLSLGIGAGLQYHKKLLSSMSFPIFVHSNYIFNTRTKLNPFINLKIGWAFGSNSGGFYGGVLGEETAYSGRVTQKAGFFLSPSAGVRYNVGNNHAFFLSLSYNLLKMNYKYKYYSNTPSASTFNNLSTLNNSTFGLRLGYEF